MTLDAFMNSETVTRNCGTAATQITTEWTAPRIGGMAAPSSEELRTALYYTERALICLSNISSFQREATSAKSVESITDHIIRCYEDAFVKHTLSTRDGRFVFPLELVALNTGVPITGTLSPSAYGGVKFQFSTFPEDAALFDVDMAEQPISAKELPAAPVETISPALPKPAEKPLPACLQHLVNAGYTLLSTGTETGPDVPQMVQQLADSIAAMHSNPFVAEFMGQLRKSLDAVEDFVQTFHYADATLGQRSEFFYFIKQLTQLGLLASTTRNDNTGTFSYSVSHSPAVLDFLRGFWLETWGKKIVTETVQQLAAKHGLPCSTAFNVELVSCGSDRATPEMELDAVFTVGGEFFWIEFKSSANAAATADKYRRRGIAIDAVPDHLLMVNAALTEQHCDGLQHFFPYFFANCSTAANAMTRMVEAALAASSATTSAA